ncbi:unnamed protein product [Eruca vesicaria subsp. sativa]|uniref:Uncharacterized protein n=1 Tax=Eruca vesicaria subsp. sativa TaxID=29727 RepID=A0ABC8M8V4_ERUVS|nr:unnamed protein product [Eruca vesicaria subsp. sativa]
MLKIGLSALSFSLGSSSKVSTTTLLSSKGRRISKRRRDSSLNCRNIQSLYPRIAQETIMYKDEQLREAQDSDDTQAPDDSQLLETELDFSCPPQFAPECNTFKWKVKIRVENGNTFKWRNTRTNVDNKRSLEIAKPQVIIHFDEDCGQPDEDSGGLLGSWLGQLSNDVNLLPIDYADWRVFAPHRKDKAWDIILTKFWFDNPDKKKNYVLSVLGSRCKDFKVRLWKMYKRNDRTETIQNRPAMVPEDQWNGFVFYRFSEKWKVCLCIEYKIDLYILQDLGVTQKMRERNINNQKKNTLPHVCGRKSFARKRQNIVSNLTPCRAEFFIASRKKSDGTFVCEEAKTRADELTLLMSENLSVERSNITASLDDEYSKVFGPERSGRVRCLGRGPTPSKLLKMSSTPNVEASNSEVVELKSQVSGLQSQVQNLAGMIQQLVGATTIQSNGTVPNLAGVLSNLANQPNFADNLSNLVNQQNSELL